MAELPEYHWYRTVALLGLPETVAVSLSPEMPIDTVPVMAGWAMVLGLDWM